MKKILLFMTFSVFLASCSKEELDLNENTMQQANAVFQENCGDLAGPDNSTTLTIEQIQDRYYSVSRLRVLFTQLRGDGVSGNGTYDPSIQDLALQFMDATNESGAYTTTYTVTDGDCTDTAEFTVNVEGECNIDAGADNTSTVLTIAEVNENYGSVSRLRDLFGELLEYDTSPEGSFNPTLEELAMRYVDAEDKTGYYSTTYTLGDGPCADSAEVAITVVED